MIVDQAIDRFGKRIVLTDERWSHIITRHPELLQKKLKVLKTVNKPEIIVEDSLDSNVNLYHRYFKQFNGYIVVIVENRKKFIITSYISPQIKRGKIIWEKNSSSHTTKRKTS